MIYCPCFINSLLPNEKVSSTNISFGWNDRHFFDENRGLFGIAIYYSAITNKRVDRRIRFRYHRFCKELLENAGSRSIRPPVPAPFRHGRFLLAMLRIRNLDSAMHGCYNVENKEMHRLPQGGFSYAEMQIDRPAGFSAEAIIRLHLFSPTPWRRGVLHKCTTILQNLPLEIRSIS